MKKNWIRLLTMLLAAMLILTMSGVVSLANDDQPVTGDGVSDVSDTDQSCEDGRRAVRGRELHRRELRG